MYTYISYLLMELDVSNLFGRKGRLLLVWAYPYLN